MPYELNRGDNINKDSVIRHTTPPPIKRRSLIERKQKRLTPIAMDMAQNSNLKYL